MRGITINKIADLSSNLNVAHNLNNNNCCSSCGVLKVCMPTGASKILLSRLDKLISVRRFIKAGATLYHSGSRFHAFYALKNGFIKTETLDEDGRNQITGFYMAGEVFGFDGIATDHHICRSIALEDSEVCVIPLNGVEHLNDRSDEIQHHFFKLMSREIVRDQTMMMLLGSMQSEERLAAFIVNLSQRYETRGYSPFLITLKMKREEIASYLGMKIETVSRTLTKFQESGLLKVHQKDVQIINIAGLKRAINQSPEL